MTATPDPKSSPSVLAIGLMSGTSLDGIDAALVETDGEDHVAAIDALTIPYDDDLRERLRASLGSEVRDHAIDALERDLTLAHADAVQALLARTARAADRVRVVGFHGHTILHRLDLPRTWQLGDGGLLAAHTGIDVVGDFRSADVAAGGQGAPLAPAFHAALAAGLDKPLAVLNIGGVANVTWIGGDGTLLAFDTGPGNALIDDWVRRHTAAAADIDGRLAASGTVSDTVLRALMTHPYFDQTPPKSLDRNEFDPSPVAALSVADGAATLAAFTVAAVARATDFLQDAPRRWLVTGGGRKNPVLMRRLGAELGVPVGPVEDVGWDGDALEAQAFAYLAVRALAGHAISWPGTTGAPKPLTGGQIFPFKR